MMTDTFSAAAAPPRYLEWGPIFGGAIAASAISFLLLTFGSAVGLSLTSPWPNTGARLWVVALAVMWWMVAVQIGSFAAGGYLAGRMRARWGTTTTPESQFRDSVHGLMVWAIGVLMGAAVLAFVGAGTTKQAAQTVSTVAAGATSGLAKSAAPADYATDLLLRPQPSATYAPPSSNGSADDSALRSETGRIFSSTITNGALTQRDQDYLTQVVTTRTGLAQPEAQKRVQDAVNEARDLEVKARDAADKARKAAIITAFTAAASLLISLAAACVAAAAGGRQRDENRIPAFSGHRFW